MQKLFFLSFSIFHFCFQIESQVTYNLDISIRYKYSVDLDVTTKLDNLQEKVIREYQLGTF